MNRRFLSWGLGLTLLTGLLLGAAPMRDVEILLREAGEAFERGDYTAAATLYEKAGDLTTDPIRVAFDLAAVRYRQALPDNRPLLREAEPLLREAEQLYRCCLDPVDPHYARALFGLGNCLFQKTDPPQVEDLRQALACYDQSLQAGTDDAELLAAARQNRELVRLRLLQILPPKQTAEEKANEQGSENKPDHRQTTAQVGQGTEMGSQRPDGKTGTTPVKPEPGQTPQATRDQPPPGAGNLKVIPDRGEVQPLPPQDAAEHLERASRRIIEEERAHRQGRPRPAAAGVRDW